MPTQASVDLLPVSLTYSEGLLSVLLLVAVVFWIFPAQEYITTLQRIGYSAAIVGLTSGVVTLIVPFVKLVPTPRDRSAAAEPTTPQGPSVVVLINNGPGQSTTPVCAPGAPAAAPMTPSFTAIQVPAPTAPVQPIIPAQAPTHSPPQAEPSGPTYRPSPGQPTPAVMRTLTARYVKHGTETLNIISPTYAPLEEGSGGDAAMNCDRNTGWGIQNINGNTVAYTCDSMRNTLLSVEGSGYTATLQLYYEDNPNTLSLPIRLSFTKNSTDGLDEKYNVGSLVIDDRVDRNTFLFRLNSTAVCLLRHSDFVTVHAANGTIETLNLAKSSTSIYAALSRDFPDLATAAPENRSCE